MPHRCRDGGGGAAAAAPPWTSLERLNKQYANYFH